MHEVHPLAPAEVRSALPAEYSPTDAEARLSIAIAKHSRKVIVLDDDPTGTQTVHGVPVLASFREEVLERYLREPGRTFYVLTNSRSLPEAEACALTEQICKSLCNASLKTGVSFAVISRSDSTLRGHYPAETDTIMATLQARLGLWFRGSVLLPAFFEGGRYTWKGIHWVEQQGQWVPAGQTEFARDPAFGYSASDLRSYVAEKTGDPKAASRVVTIPLEVIRRDGPDGVAAILERAPVRSVIAPDAVSYADLSVIVCALLEAEQKGMHYCYRTAASFVPIYCGISRRPLLSPAELKSGRPGGAGGLVVVGSHVSKSTAQLRHLVEGTAIEPVELVVERLLSNGTRRAEIHRTATEVSRHLAEGRDAVLHTSRGVVTGGGGSQYIDIARLVASGLIETVRAITARPAFFVAKGGITSSTMATDALGVQAAQVLGQILPGVPVWELGPESRLPGSNFVVFPGNVGDEMALLQVVRKLQGNEEA